MPDLAKAAMCECGHSLSRHDSTFGTVCRCVGCGCQGFRLRPTIGRTWLSEALREETDPKDARIADLEARLAQMTAQEGQDQRDLAWSAQRIESLTVERDRLTEQVQTLRCAIADAISAFTAIRVCLFSESMDGSQIDAARQIARSAQRKLLAADNEVEREKGGDANNDLR